MTKHLHLLVFVAFFFAAVAAADMPAGVSPEELGGIFAPLPEKADNQENPATPDKITLGRRLFNDTRMSRSQKLSCNSCHGLDTWGVDNEKNIGRP